MTTLTAARRYEWRKCVEDHAQENWGTTCDACIYLPEAVARVDALEAVVDKLVHHFNRAAIDEAIALLREGAA